MPHTCFEPIVISLLEPFSVMLTVAASLGGFVVSGSFFIPAVVCNFQYTSHLGTDLDCLVVVLEVTVTAVVVGAFTEFCIQPSVGVFVLTSL